MIIEVKGVQFVNKGAELMLLAILQKVRERMPEAQFVMTPKMNASFMERCRLGIYQKLSCSNFLGIDPCNLFGKVLPSSIVRDFGLVREKEIDLVLDASGYTYGDCFKTENISTAVQQFRRMRKNGTKVVLLPQAFGPFEKEKSRIYFKNLLETVDLVFPRDEQSYSYVVGVAGAKSHIVQAPDFTNLLKPFITDEYAWCSGRICLIPNNKMLSKTQGEERTNYVPFMSKSIDILLNQGEELFFLIHEGAADRELAEKINSACVRKIPILTITDALKIKSIIGSSKGVLSSRFHGLVSALCQGVPSLATAWSHKYRILFKEYDFEEGVMEVNLDDAYLRNCLSVFYDDKRYCDVKTRIQNRIVDIEALSGDMWNRVFDVAGM